MQLVNHCSYTTDLISLVMRVSSQTHAESAANSTADDDEVKSKSPPQLSPATSENK